MPQAPPSDVRQHESDFCADVKSWSEAHFAQHPELPFGSAGIEGFGPRGSRSRMDLRFLTREGKLVLCGEVKLPGTPEGRSPYDERLVADANQKADNVGCRYFFTWNVNSLLLFDRQHYERPVYERVLQEFPLGKSLENPEDVGRPDVKAHIRDVFLPDFFAKFADICLERTRDWGMPPDRHFIRALETHLDWPVRYTRDWLLATAAKDRAFSSRLEEWMARDQQWSFTRRNDAEWREAVERASRTLCYIFANRLLFYEAIRMRFDTLPALRIPAAQAKPEQVYDYFQKSFQRAVDETGDYEPLFYPTEQDWTGPLVLSAPGVLDAWHGVLESLGRFRLKEVPSDIVGKIFQGLISPEERQKFGQYYTHENIVDVINAFCIRKADAKTLDPACGSGSFLVRAYARKGWLDPSKSHQEVLMEVFGCDVALFAAHLATLNLASRQINMEDNFPQIARKNFFEIEPRKPFCTLPGPRFRGKRERDYEVVLPDLDAVVGNPPYVRQELVPRQSDRHAPRTQTKEYLRNLVAARWPGLKLSGRSDLHCYFWPAASFFLKEKGYFGFLTSSSWLDVEYGFGLQDWVLRNFRIVAVLESTEEPWFEDARVKTCVTILQRCSDAKVRNANLVRFVQIKRPLAKVLGLAPGVEEAFHQKAAEKFRNRIEKTRADYSDDNVRIIVKAQADLWREGVKAAHLIKRASRTEEDDSAHDTNGSPYGGGKWGRYLRAPDLYFDVMREFGIRFVPLGELVEIRFGVKSGCDGFFMPRDVTQWALKEEKTPLGFEEHFGCPRKDAHSGKIKIVRSGDGSVHPIENRFLAKEVQSLMAVDRPAITAADVDRVVLMVGKSKAQLRDTYALDYLEYGEKHSFASTKSDSVPVPLRSTCASRPVWYDLTGWRVGFAFWPKSQQYRHIAPLNADRITCNCNLYDLHPSGISDEDCQPLVSVLNCTLVALFKTFYGRYAGTEGNLKTEVVDVNLLQIPDPSNAKEQVRAKLKAAFVSMCKRSSGRMVEDRLMDCHDPERARKIAQEPLQLPEELRQPDRRALDEAVFEMLGVKNAERRRELADNLYRATALHFRKIRVMEIEKQVQRGKVSSRRFRPDELANDIWDSLAPEDKKPILEWLKERPGDKETINILPGPAAIGGANSFTDSTTVYFGDKRQDHIILQSRPLAVLVHLLCNLGVSGPNALTNDANGASAILKELTALKRRRDETFRALAASRTGTDKLREEVVVMLARWSMLGK